MTGDLDRHVFVLFHRLVRVLPDAFRGRFGSGIEDVLRSGYRAARQRGRAPALGFVLIALMDLLAIAIRERIQPSASPATHVSTRNGQIGEKGMRVSRLMDTTTRDVGFALRALRRRPGFTTTTVLTLGLGIGVVGTMFSVIDGVLLEPLPYPEPDRIATVSWADADEPEAGTGNLSWLNIVDARELEAFESLVGIGSGGVVLTGLATPEIIEGARVTDGLLRAFGLAPQLGRDLGVHDTGRGGPQVIVVSDGFWRSRLAGRADVVGTTLNLNQRSYEIVGVAPEGFDFPHGTRIWRPADYGPGCAESRGCRVFQTTVGRLRQGVGPGAAEADLRRLGSALAEEYPESNQGRTFNLTTLEDTLLGEVRPRLWMLMAAVGLVLLIACANVANLLLVRSATREGEMAVRAALGASRSRLTVQVLVESLVLSVLGGVVGVAITLGALGVFRGLSGVTVPRWSEIGVDGSLVLFSLAAVVSVTLLSGGLPALVSGRRSSPHGLSAGGRTGADRSGGFRFRRALLAGETALSVVLLIGAGLLVRTFANMVSVDLGYRTENVLRFDLLPSGERYEESEAIRTFYREVERGLEALPGVESVGSVLSGPLRDSGTFGSTLAVEGRPPLPPNQAPTTYVRSVTPGYFETLGIPLLRGRAIAPTDGADDQAVAVISQGFARRIFPDEDPLGQRVRIDVDLGWGSPTWTIVGVVADVRSQELTEATFSEAYVPHTQFGYEDMTVHVRWREGGPPDLEAVRGVVHGLEPDVPLGDVGMLDDAVGAELAPTRFYLGLLGLFAGLALILACVGLYGVVAYIVSRRVREMGIRLALGAEPGRLVRLILLEGLKPTLAGLVAGLAIAAAAAPILESLLYDVEPLDGAVFAVVAVAFLVVSTVAVLRPAWRASRADAVEALRSE